MKTSFDIFPHCVFFLGLYLFVCVCVCVCVFGMRVCHYEVDIQYHIKVITPLAFSSICFVVVCTYDVPVKKKDENISIVLSARVCEWICVCLCVWMSDTWFNEHCGCCSWVKLPKIYSIFCDKKSFWKKSRYKKINEKSSKLVTWSDIRVIINTNKKRFFKITEFFASCSALLVFVSQW